MQWFKNMPVLVKAFGFALTVVAFGIGTVFVVINVHAWLVGNYGQSMTESIWAVGGILLVLTGVSWLWQVLD